MAAATTPELDAYDLATLRHELEVARAERDVALDALQLVLVRILGDVVEGTCFLVPWKQEIVSHAIAVVVASGRSVRR